MMIDLKKIDEKVDTLLENESSDSLTKWLLNKRFGNVSSILGEGKFVSMQSQNTPISFKNKSANFNQKNDEISTPKNRFAA